MFNILIVGHGNLAYELVNSSKMIVGEQEGLYALGLQGDKGVDDFSERLDALFKKIYCEDGVLILADLFGGTPCNAAAINILGKYEKAEMLTGVNLSMVVEAAASRNEPLKDACCSLKGTGIENICDMREKLKEEAQEEED